MSDVVIRVENLSKKYIIGHQKQEHHTSFRDVISNGAKSLWQGFTSDRKGLLCDHSEEFWAIKDMSFEIKQGDRVGIIGRNGAGKSTLLKILSRITEPTSGRISIKGRVASLLEVGTGFHPELTGRENIYLNGAILGMDRSEIKKKFDEIVAFAEVEKFLDTPVKRYSSGMYVRLAFAVAAHLEPEILIVDEVLAVGDAAFQKKCLGKMEDVAEKEGRTVLFVSHNIGAIKTLCNQGLVLNTGNLIYFGAINGAIEEYNTTRNKFISHHYLASQENHNPYIKEIKVFQEGIKDDHFQMDLPVHISCEFDNKEVKDIVVTVVIRNSQGDWLIHSTDEFSQYPYDTDDSLRRITIPSFILAEGIYYMIFALGTRQGTLYQKLEDIIKFNLEVAGEMSDKMSRSHWKGCLAPGVLQWN
ncbi:ABC transporter, ATP-binding protein [Pseudanabaena sp. lw0831]|uniref:ABC transporter ATP-binding protein n=1 Tax=Pseudanabaena sp. lw0831 TaxID=1357935 RepID=UPI001A2C3BFB|nr:ABC transporter ATP-binding protein [Pseudanabaena sp. lw0831]GBO56890.1 ABC transporter, ATP-binding protein [Pseudanabaena sp. lw0831]